MALELVNLVAECPDAEEGKCSSYTFTGEARVGGGDFVPVSGWGYSGTYLYVLTSPARPLSFDAMFQLGGDTWQSSADYSYLYGAPSHEAPLYEGRLYVENSQRSWTFQLEPTR